MNKKQRIAAGVLAAVAVFQVSMMQVTLWLQEEPSDTPAPAPKVIEKVERVVVEENTTTLNIDSVTTVCYNGLRHWLIRYDNHQWFITPRPSRHAENVESEIMFGTNCDGTEDPIPKVNKTKSTEGGGA